MKVAAGASASVSGPRHRAAKARALASTATARDDAASEVERLVGSIEQGFLAIDRDLRYTSVSARAADLLGQQRHEMLGRSIYDFPIVVPGEFERAVERVLTERVTLLVDDHFAPTDRWFESRITPTADGVAVLFADVTERKLAALELERGVRRLELLHKIDSATLAATTVSGLGTDVLRIIRAAFNADRAAIFVYEDPEVSGQPRHARVVATDPDPAGDLSLDSLVPVIPEIDEQLRAGGLFEVEDYEQQPDPFLELAAVPRSGFRSTLIIPLANGPQLVGSLSLAWVRPAGFDRNETASVREISRVVTLALLKAQLHEDVERRAAALQTVHAIAAELPRVRPSFELGTATIAVLERLVGYEYGSILLIEEATGRLIPFAVSDQGHPGDQSFVESDIGAIMAHDVRVGDGVTGWVAEHGESARIGDIDRDSRYVAVRAGIRSELCVPIRAGDETIGVVNVESVTQDRYTAIDQLVLESVASQIGVAIQNARMHDELARRAIELEERVAQRTAELADINAELTAFTETVSHDLRAPLRGMSGFADALLADEAEHLSSLGKDYAERIVRASARLDRLIADLLAYSRLGRTDLRSRPMDLNTAVKAAIRQVHEAGDESRSQIEIVQPLGRVHADRAALVRALADLIGNAVTYSKPGQQAEIRIVSEVRGARRRLWVEDHGIGIDPRNHERIFEIFERLHGVESYAGTGVGLAVVRRVVRRMGGDCGVESELGKGSRFWIELDEPQETAS